MFLRVATLGSVETWRRGWRLKGGRELAGEDVLKGRNMSWTNVGNGGGMGKNKGRLNNANVESDISSRAFVGQLQTQLGGEHGMET